MSKQKYKKQLLKSLLEEEEQTLRKIKMLNKKIELTKDQEFINDLKMQYLVLKDIGKDIKKIKELN